MFCLNYYKGFSVIRTISLKESAEIILNMADKLKRSDGKVSFYCDLSNNNVKKYCDVVKREKKANINRDNIGIIMLAQIPKVSSATAKVIMNKYNNLSNLLNALQKDSKCLDNLKLTTKKGNERRISKSAVKNIIEFLL